MSEEYIFRVHPAIGFARVGNSEEFYLAPETMAGQPIKESKHLTGGLPIKAGTEADTITSKDLRDQTGALKRQAARFRIFQYPLENEECYPTGQGTEVRIGSVVEGKTVANIIWTVHLANKKANSYLLENPDLAPDEGTIDGYQYGKLPPLRNLAEGNDPANAARIKKLTIDPGPRTLSAKDGGIQKFDKDTLASIRGQGIEIKTLGNYPKSFPGDSFSKLDCPQGPIDTLGELRADDLGRLLVVAAYGRACGWYKDETHPYPLSHDVDNDGWFDDTADGPVSAVLVFDDKTIQEVQGGWVVSTDPGFAPQILNAVSLWDDIYDTWIRKLRLQPEIFKNKFDDNYKPYFDDQLSQFFSSVRLQRWTTNLPPFAVDAHEAVGDIKASDDPSKTILAGLGFIRNPNNDGENETGTPLMPLALGDTGKPFLSTTLTQYFFLTQWNNNFYHKEETLPLGPSEYLDKASLVNCLGGRFSPGIDMTFIVRQPEIYIQEWKKSGPFRIRAKKLDYQKAQSSQPFLGEGYVPLHSKPQTGLEPGDTSKFMAIPWHTDYNSCATHETAPNPHKSTTLYWSWPAQRPVAVFPAKAVVDSKLGPQKYSLRGKGTESDDPQKAGRYQKRIDFVKNWQRVGIVLQGPAIDADDAAFGEDQYLEVESQLDVPDVKPWPINAKEES